MDPLDYAQQVWTYLADHPTLQIIWCAVVVGLVVFGQWRAAR